MTAENDTTKWAIQAATVAEIFRAAADQNADRIFCKSSAVELTYAQAVNAIDSLAEQLGQGAKGRTVVIVLQNSPAFLVAYYAALFAGAAPALVNYGHPDETIEKLLVGLDIAAVLSDRDIPGLSTTSFDDADLLSLAQKPNAGAPSGDGKADDVAAILFSGGTTGLPKQVAHSNNVLVKKIERMEWGWPTGDGEIWLPVAPFTHIYGFLMGVLNPVLRAGTIVIPPRFHPDIIVDMLADERITVFGGGPPAIYQALMASAKFKDASFPDLRITPGGGAPFPLDVHRRWHAATGLPITEGYGMTEIAPIAVNTEHGGMKPGAAGKPPPDTVIEIVDLQTGQDVLPVGQTGEIRIKGPHMMTGYAGNPEETALTLRGGYIYTGDIGHLDDEGFLIISDRKKDVIFVKGFNVFPREVEETLMNHSAIGGACVVGREDPRAGEVTVAFITVEHSINAEDVRQHCAELLTNYKVPEDIIIVDELPLTPAGKVDRMALRNQARARNQT